MNPTRRRLLQDEKKISNSPPEDGIFASPNIQNMMKWDAVIIGPEDTPWEGGTFQLDINFANDYPNHPPHIQFKTKMYHPNIYEDGKICVDFLQNQWSKTYDVLTILTSIRSLLNDPNPESPANTNAAQLYLNNRKQYYKKVKDNVELSWIYKN